MVKDRPDDNFPKIAKQVELSFSFKKPIVGDRPNVGPGLILSQVWGQAWEHVLQHK